MDFTNTHIHNLGVCYVCRRSETEFQNDVTKNYNDQMRSKRRMTEDELEKINSNISKLFTPLVDKFSQYLEKFKDKDYLDFKLSAVYEDFTNFQKLIPNLGVLLVLFYPKPQRNYNYYGRRQSNYNSDIKIRDLLTKLAKSIDNIKEGMLDKDIATLLNLDNFPEILYTGTHEEDESEVEYIFEDLRESLEYEEVSRNLEEYYDEFDDDDLNEIMMNIIVYLMLFVVHVKMV